MTVSRETRGPRRLSMKSRMDCTGLRLNPELGRDRPATNYLNHRTVFAVVLKGKAAQTQENYMIFV